MCNFLSAVISRTGEIYCNPLIDSHEDIIDYFNLKDSLMGHIVRVEFCPEKTEELVDVTKYKLVIDEPETPEWFDGELKEKVIDRLTTIVKNLIITDDRKILVGGAYIIASGKIDKLINCEVKYAGSSTIEYAGYSTIKNAGYSTIENAGSSTIENAGYSTIENAGYSTIENAGYSTIENAGYSTIENAGSSTIENAGYSTIKNAGSSTIDGVKHENGKAINVEKAK